VAFTGTLPPEGRPSKNEANVEPTPFPAPDVALFLVQTLLKSNWAWTPTLPSASWRIQYSAPVVKRVVPVQLGEVTGPRVIGIVGIAVRLRRPEVTGKAGDARGNDGSTN